MKRNNFINRKKKSTLISRLNKPKTVNQKQNKAIMNLQKKVSKLQKSSEVKFRTFTHLFQALTIGETSFLFNGLLKGTSSDQRVGDSVKLLSIVYRSLITHQGTDRTFVRVILYIDRQNNNVTTFESDEILLNTSSNLDATISVFEPMFVGKNKKYQILFDEYFQVTSGTISGNSGVTANHTGTQSHDRIIRKVIRLGHTVRYSGNAGNGLDIINNALRVLYITDDAQASMGHSVKLMYIDT